MKKILAILILMLHALSMDAGNDYIKYMEDADKAIEKGEYDNAIALLKSALELEPDNSGNVMLLSNLGMLNYYTGRDSLAIHYLSVAHEMAPKSITILSNRAKVYTEIHRFKRALDDLDEICQLDSTLYTPYLSKGVIYLTLNDIPNAQKSLEQMSKLTDTSKSIECTAALAWLATMTDDNEMAMKQYSILIDNHPEAAFYASRAICNIALEMYTQASEDIASGLELDPECAELYVAKAYLNKRTYLNDEALKDAQRAIELGADKDRVRRLVESSTLR